MKARFMLLALAALIVLSSAASAERCEDVGYVSVPFICWSHKPNCTYANSMWAWAGWPDYYCKTCPSPARCNDYTLKGNCERDPCDAIPGSAACVWNCIPINGYCDDIGYCDSGCARVQTRESYSSNKFRNCTDNKCNYEWVDISLTGSLYSCTDCSREMKCSDYGPAFAETADGRYQCEKDPCDVPGKCGWDVDEKECVEDIDGDGKLGDKDNCPDIYNPDQNNTYCHTQVTYDSNTKKCNPPDKGDVCDDTDGDGVLDAQEFSYNTSPIDTDTDDNCITDGVEFMFQPIINVLNKIAIAVATVMLMYMGLKWVTSEEESGRANAKAAVVYILVGLLLLVGGKNIVIFILQTKCTGETPKMVEGTDFWWCSADCKGAAIVPPSPFSSIALLLSPNVMHQAPLYSIEVVHMPLFEAGRS